MGVFRNVRRSLMLKEGLIPAEDWDRLLEDHPILDGLSRAETEKLRMLSTVFLHEKTFEGADGLVLTDFIRAVISLQACLPILELGIDWYEDWKTVVVVPDVFVEEHFELDQAGVAHEWEEDKSGESWDLGPVVLSWKDVEASGWGDGYNVVIHEAAHRLDLSDGLVNGRPALHEEMDASRWRDVFSHAFTDIGGRAGKRRKRPGIDPYAAENDAEFFAVASEYFFEMPRTLIKEYPDVYRLLTAFYKQDPSKRLC